MLEKILAFLKSPRFGIVLPLVTVKFGSKPAKKKECCGRGCHGK